MKFFMHSWLKIWCLKYLTCVQHTLKQNYIITFLTNYIATSNFNKHLNINIIMKFVMLDSKRKFRQAERLWKRRGCSMRLVDVIWNLAKQAPRRTMDRNLSRTPWRQTMQCGNSTQRYLWLNLKVILIS